MKKPVSIDEMKEVLDYDPATGVFTWKERPTKNGKYFAGRKAGSWSTRMRDGSKHLTVSYNKQDISLGRLAWAFTYNEWPKYLSYVDGNSENLKVSNLMIRAGTGPTGVPYTDRPAWQKANRALNPEIYQNASLKKSFGIGLREYNKMLAFQNGCCAICKKPERAVRNGKVKALSVDHCHDSSEVRGLLCSTCNVMIGMSRDNEDLLFAGGNYVVRDKKLKEERAAILASQKGKCAVCDKSSAVLKCDVDFERGQMRGYLCEKCLGMVRLWDTPEKMMRAAEIVDSRNEAKKAAQKDSNVIPLKGAL